MNDMNKTAFTLLLILLMSMVRLQAFAEWDTSTKVQVDSLYYYLDDDSLQAQVTSVPNGKYAGDIVIPVEFTYEGKVYRTRGLDADQTEAAIKATIKMLNMLEDEKDAIN